MIWQRMVRAQHNERRERGRAELLAAIGDVADLTLIRGPGNIGDELIEAGTHALLSDRRYRTITLNELASASGDAALLLGNGAFSRSYHEWTPWALAVAEQRFERVVVLPSSFDVAVDAVRHALCHTRAIVFAREQQSLQTIGELCDARIAFDMAFYYDFADHVLRGDGVLNALREDREAPADLPLPGGNLDISANAASLQDWLAQIASHAIVRTNRTHVMIAAALLGKRVELAPASWFKLEAVADYCLAEFSVRRLGTPVPSSVAVHRPTRPARRVSLLTGPPVSPPETEYAMLVGSGVTIGDQALERLLAELDRHREAAAAVPCVIRPGGEVVHCGGELRERDGIVDFRPLDTGRDQGALAGVPAEPCDWVPSPAVLIRASALRQWPLNTPVDGPYQAAEWSYRLTLASDGTLRRCPAAVAISNALRTQPSPGSLVDHRDFYECCLAMPVLEAMARFYRLHGAVIGDLFTVFPGLIAADGTREVVPARLLLELFDGIGASRFLSSWCRGELAALVEPRRANPNGTAEVELTAELGRVVTQLAQVRATRAWRLACSLYRFRDGAKTLVGAAWSRSNGRP